MSYHTHVFLGVGSTLPEFRCSPVFLCSGELDRPSQSKTLCLILGGSVLVASGLMPQAWCLIPWCLMLGEIRHTKKKSFVRLIDWLRDRLVGNESFLFPSSNSPLPFKLLITQRVVVLVLCACLVEIIVEALVSNLENQDSVRHDVALAAGVGWTASLGTLTPAQGG